MEDKLFPHNTNGVQRSSFFFVVLDLQISHHELELADFLKEAIEDVPLQYVLINGECQAVIDDPIVWHVNTIAPDGSDML